MRLSPGFKIVDKLVKNLIELALVPQP